MRAANRRWTIVGIVFLTVAAVVPVTAALTRDRAQAAAAAVGDGTTSATAGASCWGIKQQYPASVDGAYWLLTKSMDRPARFACDMTTAGGGWVLIARGRNGWSFNPNGQGSPASVSDTPDGPDAFAPAALPTGTIDDLLDHSDLSTQPDGIRLERATDTNGNTRQDYRLHAKGRSWTWNLAAGQLLNKVVINGTTYNGSNTKDTSAAVQGQTVNQLSSIQDTRQLFTYALAAHNNEQGFAMGGKGGSSAADSYLWAVAKEGQPLGFTKVWLRPRIANDAAGFTPIPAAGYPAQAKPNALNNRSEIAPYGVVGIDHTNESIVSPWNNNVSILKVYNDRVYVGGRFTGVQAGPGASPVAQRSLAMFDIDGNWISTFRPQFAGRVWDMTLTDNGKLIVAGDFTSVNGLPNTAGLVALDPVTGAVITSWKGSVSRSAGFMVVRAVDSRGPWIYAAGRFTSVDGGTATNVGVPNTINLNTTNGQPGNWRPVIHASAARIRVSAAGDRVYLGGWFNSVNGDANQGFYAITNIADGTPAAGIGAFQPSAGSGTRIYQQAVAESGNNLLVGGSQHDLQLYDHNRTSLLNSHITKSGGDFQAIEVIDGYVYASCHCINWNYSGTNDWSNPRNFRAIDPIRFVGRYDATTLDYDTTWYPNGTKGDNDEGIWGIAQDSRKCLWVGGDLVRGSYSGNVERDWLGGFARFCGTDVTPPTTPTALQATVTGPSVTLTWGAGTDASGTVSYDVYRNDRVIATVFGTSFSDTPDNGANGALRYTVRAADARGNRSASPAPVAVNGPAPQLGTPIDFGATWQYRADGADLGTAWRIPAAGDPAWPTGPAVLGWGDSSVATTIDGAGRPTTSYFRKTFDVADPRQVKLLDLQARFTQGAVVYVNGIEVGRTNMPAGSISSTTVASAWVGGSENDRIKTYVAPGSLLRAGTNTVAVEVHGWRAGSGKVFFDLAAGTRGASADQTPPTRPTLTANPSRGGVDLSWTPSTDDQALGGYVVSRDGAALAVVSALASTFVDADIMATTTHTYVVTAFDTAGNTNASAAVPVATGIDPALLGFNSQWRWYYQATAPAGPWAADGYDDSLWAAGAGELGFGDTPKSTIITTDPAPRPLTSYYRATVNIADPTAFARVAVDLIRNAGAVVYVNGVEVGRSNMPAGTVTDGTYATTWVPSAERHVPVRIEVPSSAFRAGANTIAVELHLNYRSQSSAGFDLALTGLN